MDAADLELFERTVRAATESLTGSELDAALDDLGWTDALAAEPRAAVSVLFEQQGRAGASSSALDWLLLATLGFEHANLAVVLPSLGHADAPGQLDGDRVTVRGLGEAALATADVAVVVARSGGAHVALTVDTFDLEIRPIRGIDPWLELVEVTGETSVVDERPVDWGRTVATAQVAVGHELVGTARQMLELARLHALERVQFAQPIAMFQAVRHRLADTLVAIETADALLDAAWQDGSPTTAAMAKAVSGRGARTAARHCQQVLAGIGFTTDHPLHRSIRRALALDQLFGSSRSLTSTLGAELLATGELPSLLPL